MPSLASLSTSSTAEAAPWAPPWAASRSPQSASAAALSERVRALRTSSCWALLKPLGPPTSASRRITTGTLLVDQAEPEVSEPPDALGGDAGGPIA